MWKPEYRRVAGGMGKHLLGMDAQPKPARSAISDAPPRSVGNLCRYMLPGPIPVQSIRKGRHLWRGYKSMLGAQSRGRRARTRKQ